MIHIHTAREYHKEIVSLEISEANNLSTICELGLNPPTLKPYIAAIRGIALGTKNPRASAKTRGLSRRYL